METPSSQANTYLNNTIPISKKIENSDKGVSKSRPRTGALIDITNDSPIVGLAMGKLETPLSLMSKKRIIDPQSTNTPGSGEALLRCQVKTLLQKVEEEAEISKISHEKNKQFLNFQGFLNSPMALIAPTPANTPQIGNLLGSEAFRNVCLAGVTPSPVPEQLMISQMVSSDNFNGMKREGNESEKDWITRSLFLDFSDKSEGSDSCSSVLTKNKASASEDDSSSAWSLQVNTSAKDGDDDDDFVYVDDEVEDDDGGLVNELCEGFRKISVEGTKFEGKHTRFIYNSDSEIEGEEECGSGNKYSPSIVRLKGLPSPKGKHLRFPDSC